jgi:Icc-related predicted phosphoesterase
MKLLFASDVQGRLFWMENLLSWMPHDEVDGLALAGDLLSALEPSSDALPQEAVEVYQWLEKLASYGKPVIVATGNHDGELFAPPSVCLNDSLHHNETLLHAVAWDVDKKAREGVHEAHKESQRNLYQFVVIHHRPPQRSSLSTPSDPSRQLPPLENYGNQLVAKLKPDFYLCGYVHNPKARRVKSGRTILLNAAADPDRDGMPCTHILLDTKTRRSTLNPFS